VRKLPEPGNFRSHTDVAAGQRLDGMSRGNFQTQGGRCTPFTRTLVPCQIRRGSGMQSMGLSVAAGAVTAISGGAGVDVATVWVAPTSFDAGDGDLELALLLDVVAADAAGAALLARELDLSPGGDERAWVGWIRSPRGSAAPIRCAVRAHDPHLDGALGGRAAQISTLATAVNAISGGMGIDIAAVAVCQTAPFAHAVDVQAADIVSARVLASDLGLEPTPQHGSMTWGGWTRPARGTDQIKLTVTVRPTADFLAAFTDTSPVETGR